MLRSPACLSLALAASVCLSAVAGAGQETPTDGVTPTPNILIVVADDLGVDKLRPYGGQSEHARTPTLDVLADRGVIFTNAWSMPLCSPSRATLQTGRLPFRTGVGALMLPSGLGLPESEQTIPEMVDVGTGGAYAHAAFGKWALKVDAQGGVLAPNVAGWGHYAGTYELFSYYVWSKVVNGKVSTATQYVTSDVVDDAVEWIEEQDSPWMVYLAFNAPHAPFHTPPSALHSVDLSDAGSPDENPAPYYLAMVEAMDTELGRLLESIGSELDDTVVIFTSDNGTPAEVVTPPHDPAHAKLTAYQGGVHVPLIVSGSVVEQGGVSSALVGISDIFATVADLVGADVDDASELDSLSLIPFALDPTLPSQRAVLHAESFLPNGFTTPLIAQTAARDERYKLIRFWDGDELYDLVDDPLELNDLLIAKPVSEEHQHAYQSLVEASESLHGFLGPSVHAYGCPDTNPAGSLGVVEDGPMQGGTLTFLLDNPIGTQLPGTQSFLLWSVAPNPGFPCGEAFPEWGMTGGEGEFLLASAEIPGVVAGSVWTGLEPVQVQVEIPLLPAVVDETLFVQGMLVDLTGASEVEQALTNALAIQVGP